MSGGLLLGLLVGFSANATLYIYLYTRETEYMAKVTEQLADFEKNDSERFEMLRNQYCQIINMMRGSDTWK
jgi:hypothetical protein